MSGSSSQSCKSTSAVWSVLTCKSSHNAMAVVIVICVMVLMKYYYTIMTYMLMLPLAHFVCLWLDIWHHLVLRALPHIMTTLKPSFYNWKARNTGSFIIPGVFSNVHFPSSSLILFNSQNFILNFILKSESNIWKQPNYYEVPFSTLLNNYCCYV